MGCLAFCLFKSDQKKYTCEKIKQWLCSTETGGVKFLGIISITRASGRDVCQWVSESVRVQIETLLMSPWWVRIPTGDSRQDTQEDDADDADGVDDEDDDDDEDEDGPRVS